LQILTTGESQ